MTSEGSEDPTPSIPSELIEAIAEARFRLSDPAQAIEALCDQHPKHAEAIRIAAADPMSEAMTAVTPPSQQRTMTAERPTQIGPYRIESILGEGGMGTVYRAEQQEPVKRTVALKVIKLGMDSRAVVTRFEHERQALALMDHEGIAKVFDCGTTERGQPFFVMELVQGVPLDQFCEQQELSLADRLLLMQQVCAAVQHAHQKGVVHRDLKPGNVLVRADAGKPQVKIIDFGLAKAMGEKLIEASMFTEVGQVIGTPEYMAPEQADPGNQDIDTRVDIYSLGVMLYEVLVDELPFPSAELRKVGMLEVQRVLRDVDPPKPSTRLSSGSDRSSKLARSRQVSVTALSKALKNDLDWVVMKALEKDRARRYETANALAADLQRFLDHEPLFAGPPSASYRLKKLARRYRTQVAAVAAVALSLIAGIVAFAVENARAHRNAEAALLRGDVAQSSLVRLVDTLQKELNDVPLREVRIAREKLLEEARRDLVRLTDDDWLPRSSLSTRTEVGALTNSALLVAQRDDRPRAEELLNRAVAMSRADLAASGSSLDSLHQLADCLLLRVQLQRRFGELAAALDSASEAEALLRSRTGTDPRRLWSVVMQQGHAASNMLDGATAAERYAVALNVARAIHDSQPDELLLATSLQDSGLAQLTLGDVDAGLKLIDEAVASFRRAVTERAYSLRGLLGLAGSLRRRGEVISSNIRLTREALRTFEEAADIYRRVLTMDPDDRRTAMQLADALAHTATSHRRLGARDSALESLQEAIQFARSALAHDPIDRLAFNVISQAFTTKASLLKADDDAAMLESMIAEYETIIEKAAINEESESAQVLSSAMTRLDLIEGLLRIRGGEVPISAIEAVESIGRFANRSPQALNQYLNALLALGSLHGAAKNFTGERSALLRFEEQCREPINPLLETPFYRQMREIVAARLEEIGR